MGRVAKTESNGFTAFLTTLTIFRDKETICTKTPVVSDPKLACVTDSVSEDP
jgi:hypothetical protein